VKIGPKGGIRNLLTGRKSYSTEYTMHSKDSEATFQVNVLVKYSEGKYGRNGIEYFAYAVYNVDLHLKIHLKNIETFWNRIQLQTNKSSMNTHQHKKNQN
jgi:hypothetical protein